MLLLWTIWSAFVALAASAETGATGATIHASVRSDVWLKKLPEANTPDPKVSAAAAAAAASCVPAHDVV